MNLKTKVMVALGQDTRSTGEEILKVTSVRIPVTLLNDLKKVADMFGHEQGCKVSSGAIIRALITVLLSEETITVSSNNPIFKDIEPHQQGADARSLDPEDNSLPDTVDSELNITLHTEQVTSSPGPKPISENPLMDQILNSSLTAEERALLEALNDSPRPVAKKWSP